MHFHLNINCFLFLNEHKVQNQYMKEMLSKAIENKLLKTFLVNIKVAHDVLPQFFFHLNPSTKS